MALGGICQGEEEEGEGQAAVPARLGYEPRRCSPGGRVVDWPRRRAGHQRSCKQTQRQQQQQQRPSSAAALKALWPAHRLDPGPDPDPNPTSPAWGTCASVSPSPTAPPHLLQLHEPSDSGTARGSLGSSARRSAPTGERGADATGRDGTGRPRHRAGGDSWKKLAVKQPVARSGSRRARAGPASP